MAEQKEFWDRRELIRRSNLSTAAKLVLYTIADYDGQEKGCFVHQDQLAKDVSLGPRQLRNVMAMLAGVVKAERRGRGKTNRLKIDWEALAGLRDDRQSVAGHARDDDRQPVAGQSDDRQSIAGPERQPVAGPERQPVAGPERQPVAGHTTYITQRLNTNINTKALTPIPAELDTPEFGDAWADWIQHRREIHKPLKSTAAKKQIAKLAAMGHDRAVAAINHSVAQGWTGIYEDDVRKRKPVLGAGCSAAAAKYDPERAEFATFG